MCLAVCAFRSGLVKRKGLPFLREVPYSGLLAVRPRTTRKASNPVVPSSEGAAARARQALYDARIRAGLTQEDASGKRSTSTLSRWESGVHEPSWAELDAYAHELGEPIILRFGPEPTNEAAPPAWAQRLERKLDRLTVEQVPVKEVGEVSG